MALGMYDSWLIGGTNAKLGAEGRPEVVYCGSGSGAPRHRPGDEESGFPMLWSSLTGGI